MLINMKHPATQQLKSMLSARCFRRFKTKTKNDEFKSVNKQTEWWVVPASYCFIYNNALLAVICGRLTTEIHLCTSRFKPHVYCLNVPTRITSFCLHKYPSVNFEKRRVHEKLTFLVLRKSYYINFI